MIFQIHLDGLSLQRCMGAEELAVRRTVSATLLLAPICLASVDPAVARETPSRLSCAPPWERPWVADQATAKQIYAAVGRARFPSLFKQYPIVVARDGGDHWELSQESGKPPPKAKRAEIIVSAGGGQLRMNIDKCTGAISYAALNR